MRILTIFSFVTLVLFSQLAPTKAEAQCLLCGVIGFAIGSASGDEQIGSSIGGNVIYVAPYINKRISDPLEVRIAVSNKMGFSNPEWIRSITKAQSMTLSEIFELTISDSADFTILEIMRVIEPGGSRIAVFWFAYIENAKMRPLSELKKITK